MSMNWMLFLIRYARKRHTSGLKTLEGSKVSSVFSSLFNEIQVLLVYCYSNLGCKQLR